MSPTGFQPIGKGACGSSYGLARGPRQDVVGNGDLASGGYKAEPLGDPINLTVRATWAVHFAEVADDLAGCQPNLINLRDDGGEVGAGGDTIILTSCIAQMPRERLRCRKIMQSFEHPEARSRVGRNIHDPYLLTGS